MEGIPNGVRREPQPKGRRADTGVNPNGLRHAPAGTPRAVPAPPVVTWKLHREVVLLAGWGRAILMQLAHPLVAQGVADHSHFARDPRASVDRLRSTLRAMLTLTFGSDEEAQDVAARIVAIHDRVHGVVPMEPGRIAAGLSYSAHDPALLAWVHATLVDSFLATYELFVGDLTPDEGDRYCHEATRIEPMLGIPIGRLPRTRADLRSELAARLDSAEIAVTDTARALAREIVNPRLPWPARPLVPVARLPTIGMLPLSLRTAYGFPWSRRHDRALSLVAAASRSVVPLVPPLLRHWPSARRALARTRTGGANSR